MILDILFPKFCINCKREGEYLCQDCHSLIDISEYFFCLCEKPNRLPENEKCSKCSKKHQLKGLYFAASYQNNIIQKLIHLFKYEPFAKDLAKTITYIIISHLQLFGKEKKDFSDYLIVPVPLTIKRLKWRGFNQAEAIGKELASFLEIPLLNNVLAKRKETIPQIKLSKEERRENIRGSFSVINQESIRNQKILLIDDVYTTGATMEECTRILKAAGAKEIWGIVVARG